MGISVKLFTAETDKEDLQYKQLISTSKLPAQCVIATKYLDVGVNIISKLNLVIYETDDVELQQMIGRKRLTSPEEKVHVYFYIPSISELQKRQNGLTKKISDIEKCIYALKNNEYIESIEAPFYIESNRVGYNSLCLKKFKWELQYCKRLIEFLDNYKNTTERNNAYAKLLLQEFPKVSYCDEDLLINNPEEKLLKLLENFFKKTLSKEEFETFSGKIVKILGDPRIKPRETPPGISKINDVIQPFGFSFVVSGDPTTYTLIREEEKTCYYVWSVRIWWELNHL